jgi:acyl-CoA reductase-like NAD-dependent aldehyde dehydrogenase
MATERIIIHSSIVEPFSTAFKAAIEKFFTSNGSGPILITPADVKKNKKLIDQAVSRGATLLVGDLDSKETSQTRMRPVVLENVNHDMDIYQQESFGPSVSLFTVDTEEKAIAIANDTEYGLSAAVFTRDLAAGLRIARQIESGYVYLVLKL